jgi:MFS family permease
MTTTNHRARPGQAGADPGRLTLRLRLILAVVLLADVLDLMDSTITNIAAPTVVRDIGGGESLIKWLGASYALAMGVLLVVGGRLGDRYGKRRMFLIGMAGFTAASLWCGLSVDPVMLIAGRLVQGGFGALLIPQGISILIAAFSRDQLRGAFTAFGPVMGISAVLGPIVAGLIISANIAGLTWRPIFLINIVLGTAGFAAALRLLPRDRPVSNVPIDGLGAGLLGASIFALIYGLIEGSTAGWTALPIGCLAAGVALLAGFGVRQRLATAPLIQPSLLANRGFTAGLLLGLAFFAAVNGLAYVISLFFQDALGLSARAASIALSPVMIGIIIASFVCRPLLAKLGRMLVVLGHGPGRGNRGQRVGPGSVSPRPRTWHGRLLHQHLRRRDRRRGPGRGRQRQRLAERRPAALRRHRLGRRHERLLQPGSTARCRARHDRQRGGRRRDRAPGPGARLAAAEVGPGAGALSPGGFSGSPPAAGRGSRPAACGPCP